MTNRIPAWVWRLGQVAVAVALFTLLWRAADGPEAARTVVGADVSLLVVALLALTIQTILSALRWQLTARQLGLSFGTWHAIREYYLAQVVNQSLPGGMIGDAGRAYRTRAEAGLLASGQAVVIERLAGQIAMFATLSVGFVATSLIPGGLDWPAWLAWPVAGIIAAGIAIPLVMLAAIRLPGAFGHVAGTIWRVLHTTMINRRVLPYHIALGAGTTLCNLAAFAFCAGAVGVDLSLGATAGLVPLILFTMLIPVSISGWGLREGAAAALLPLAGASASSGLAASVVFGLTFIVAVLPGVVFVVLKPRAPVAKCTADRPDTDHVGRYDAGPTLVGTKTAASLIVKRKDG